MIDLLGNLLCIIVMTSTYGGGVWLIGSGILNRDSRDVLLGAGMVAISNTVLMLVIGISVLQPFRALLR